MTQSNQSSDLQQPPNSNKTSSTHRHNHTNVCNNRWPTCTRLVWSRRKSCLWWGFGNIFHGLLHLRHFPEWEQSGLVALRPSVDTFLFVNSKLVILGHLHPGLPSAHTAISNEGHCFKEQEYFHPYRTSRQINIPRFRQAAVSIKCQEELLCSWRQTQISSNNVVCNREGTHRYLPGFPLYIYIFIMSAKAVSQLRNMEVP